MLRVLFTGASSFSGVHFVEALVRAGHRVAITLQKTLPEYAGLRRQRLDRLADRVEIHEEAPFGSRRFLEILEAEPWERLCHHGADTTNYRSLDFDVLGAVARNSHNARAVVASLASKGASLVLSGTFSEPTHEVSGYEPAFNPYSLSKALTGELFLFETYRAHVPLTKFVLGNPFGPLEEGRFTNYLVGRFRKGETAEVMTPEYVRDNVPVDLMAAAYAKSVASSPVQLFQTLSPSGYVERQGDFARRVARELGARLPWNCVVSEGVQTTYVEPPLRINRTSARTMVSWDEKKSWDDFALWAQDPEAYIARV